MPLRILLVDALNLIRRIYAGIPGPDCEERAHQCSRQTLAKLQGLLQLLTPSHAIVVFDNRQHGWRHQLHPGYKQQRSPMPQPLAEQLEQLTRQIQDQGLTTYLPDMDEADDVIATIASKVAARGGEAVIVSTDQGYGQVIGQTISQYDPFGQRWLDAAFYRDKHGIAPDRLPQLWALTGHHGNQIPGVPGIGAKTARKLLADHADLDALLQSEQLPSRWQEKLNQNREQAQLSLQLATLKRDCQLGINLQELRVSSPSLRRTP